MTEFKSEDFNEFPAIQTLKNIILKNHKVADHTVKTLYKNRKIKDYCEEARHFVMFPGKPALFVYYDVSSWYKHPGQALVKIESIGVYDDYLEYESARMKGLHSGNPASGNNLN